MAEHVRAEIVDAGRELQSIEELANSVAGERVAGLIGEERRVGVDVALPDIVDVHVELLRGLEVERDVACFAGLARRGSDVETSFAEVDVAEP